MPFFEGTKQQNSKYISKNTGILKSIAINLRFEYLKRSDTKSQIALKDNKQIENENKSVYNHTAYSAYTQRLQLWARLCGH